MFFWFIGTSIATVRFVFQDPRFDHRLLIVGAVLPLVDLLFGRIDLLHTLVFSLFLLAIVMLATLGRRPARALLLGLPIGTLLHLVFDGAWMDNDLFWWPAGGWSFAGRGVARGRTGVVERAARDRRPGDPGLGVARLRAVEPCGAAPFLDDGEALRASSSAVRHLMSRLGSQASCASRLPSSPPPLHSGVSPACQSEGDLTVC